MGYLFCGRQNGIGIRTIDVCGGICIIGMDREYKKRRGLKMEEKKQRPQDKWDKKAGMVSKTYKVNKEAAEAFQQACKEAGIAMGVQLSNMMREFAEKNTKK